MSHYLLIFQVYLIELLDNALKNKYPIIAVLQPGSQNIHLPLNGRKWTLQCADSNSDDVSWLINSLTQSSSPLKSYFMTSFDHSSGISSDVVFDPVHHLNQTNLTCLTFVNHSVTAIYTAILIIEGEQ